MKLNNNKLGRSDPFIMAMGILVGIYVLFFYNGGLISTIVSQQEPVTEVYPDNLVSVTYTTVSTYAIDSYSPEDNLQETNDGAYYFDESSTTVIVGDTDNTLELTRYTI